MALVPKWKKTGVDWAEVPAEIDVGIVPQLLMERIWKCGHKAE